MIGIILASHGNMAEGMLDTAKEVFSDLIPQIETICFKGAESLEELDVRIDKAIQKVDSGQGVVILCDLAGGTPCNRSMLKMNDRIQVFGGVNFAMLLELLSGRVSGIDIAEVDFKELLDIGKIGMIHANALLK